MGQFENNVEVVDCLVDIIELDNVGAFELFVDLDFGIESILVILVLENLVLIDNLDCHLGLGLLLNSQVDFRESPFSQFGAKEDDIFAYSLLCVAHQLNEI